ncbi:glycosyltransferase [Escherichia coli]|uniref:glycosyltransferase n=1 Tax=Escherichia coli TaxID=562 RepID=UPI001804F108|nr:glycosyltransferase [Escherichia coli]EFB3399652.1 glycosyltransferase [Escherichia coli]MBC0276188.1 glycosyltransferase [Escherichia coli]HCL9475419.1 glycosyltransferase [Escherichia coli]
MMNSTNKLSVIIPLYNAGNDFRTCMESLIAQTWTALEIIIINDNRQGNKNLNYQRHYIKITRLLEKLNRNYADKITIYPEFHQQITYEALRVCHAVRKEPDIITRQRMIAEIFTSGMYKRLITNVRSVKVGYQALLWSFRLWQWRDKTRSHHRITRSAFNLR